MKLTYTKSLGQALTTYEIEGDYDECLRMAKALDITPVVNFKLDPIVKQTPATVEIVQPVYHGDGTPEHSIPLKRSEDGSIKTSITTPTVHGVVGESDEGIDLGHKIKQAILKEKRPGGLLA